MTHLFMHYAIPSENLPELATVGCAKVAMFAFRCGDCQEDFHIDHKPNYCPKCGIYFLMVTEFGQRERSNSRGGMGPAQDEKAGDGL